MLTLITAVALGALTLAGCGGSGESAADKSAQEILQSTFGDENAKVSSGRLTLAADLADLEGAEGLDTIKLSGPFQSATGDGDLPKFAFTLTIKGGGSSFDAGATSTGDKGFLRFQGSDYAVPAALFQQFVSGYNDQKKQAEGESADQPTLKALGIEPLNWLTDPKKAGEAEVGGVETVQITAGVAVPKLLEDLQKAADRANEAAGQQLTPQDIEQLTKSIKSATVDVFTGKDDERLRRMVVDLQLASGNAKLTLEIADLDVPQKIEAPAETKPLEDLLALFQGATGQGGVTAPDSGGASSGAGGDSQQYLECIQEAGQDLEQAQACAKFL